MSEPIDILENRVLKETPGLLEVLLKDHTTQQNIFWATDSYAELGDGFRWHDSITVAAITGEHGDVIMPRVMKTRDEQQRRVKQMAEVFTPAWLVNKMNNAADEVWFGRQNVFNVPTEEGWRPTEAPVMMPKGKSWHDYVLATRLEITCGEAPFLTSRYDMISGVSIAIKTRMGMLDRKLRIVNEHCTGDEWTRWALLALGSVYGFEWQGDNLLLARESLLASFSESYEQQFGHKADRTTLMLAAEIIAWNVWQMDGLKGVVPASCRETRIMETDFFGETKVTSVSPCPGCEHDDITLHNGMRCCLRRWLPSEPMSPNHFDYNYTEIITKKYKTYHKNKYLMKFDFVIGNPPYQEETVGTSDTPVYDRFMDASFVVSKKALLITPARFLFNAGKTPSAWNKKMLNDEHFKVLDYYPVSDKVFSNTDIKGGVAVTYRDETQKLGPIGVFTTYPELNSIYKKVTSNMEQGGLTDLFYMQNKFKLNTLYADYPQYKNIIGSEGKERRLTAAILYQLDVFTEAQEKDEDVAIIGVINNKRVKRYIDRKYLDLEKTNLNKWKVLVPKSNGSGVLGEVLSTPLIAEPTMGYTQTFLGIGAFDNESEAQAAYKYIISKFARTMLGVLKITQDNPPEKWKNVPLQDFTNHSDIDWTKSVHKIDLQLYDKYGLSADERNFIETHVKAMDE
jgi:type II restriction enzyme